MRRDSSCQVLLERASRVGRPVAAAQDVEPAVAGPGREAGARRDAADERVEAGARRQKPRKQLVLEADRELLGPLRNVDVEVPGLLLAQTPPGLGPRGRSRRRGNGRRAGLQVGSGRRRGRSGNEHGREHEPEPGAMGHPCRSILVPCYGTATAAWERRGSAPADSRPDTGSMPMADTKP